MTGLKLFVGILTLYVATVCSAPLPSTDDGSIAKALTPNISDKEVREKIDQALRKQIPGAKVDALERVENMLQKENKESWTGTSDGDMTVESGTKEDELLAAARDCAPYLSEKGRNFFMRVRENSEFEKEIETAEEELEQNTGDEQALMSDEEEQVIKSLKIAAFLKNKGYNPRATPIHGLQPEEAFKENTPQECLNLIKSFIPREISP